MHMVQVHTTHCISAFNIEAQQVIATQGSINHIYKCINRRWANPNWEEKYYFIHPTELLIMGLIEVKVQGDNNRCE